MRCVAAAACSSRVCVCVCVWVGVHGSRSCVVHARLRAISEGIKEHSSSAFFFLKLTGKAFSFRGYLIING